MQPPRCVVQHGNLRLGQNGFSLPLWGATSCPDGPSCLTAGQVTAARSLYRGTFDGKGRKFFPGYMPGAEAVPGAWDLWLTGPKAQHGIFAGEFFRNMVYSNPEWQPASFDVARDYAAARRLAPVLDSDNPVGRLPELTKKLLYGAVLPAGVNAWL